MLVTIIILCEIGFWALIAAGLVSRYLLHRPRLGAVLLAATPLVDLLLLTVTYFDLRSGAQAGFTHVLSALYLGFSVVYGHRLIAWADRWATHLLQAGPRPPALHGMAYARSCWVDVLRTLASVLIAAAVLGLLVLAVGDPTTTAPLLDAWRVLGLILAIDVVWAASYTIWPKRPHADMRQG